MATDALPAAVEIQHPHLVGVWRPGPPIDEHPARALLARVRERLLEPAG